MQINSCTCHWLQKWSRESTDLVRLREIDQWQRDINHILVELFLQTLRCYMTSSCNVHFLCYFYIWFWRRFQHLHIQDRLETFEDACNYFGLVSLRLFCITFRKSLTDFYRSVYLSRFFFEASKTNSFRLLKNSPN